MANNTVQLANQAQEMTRSVYGAVQGLGQTQLNVLQRLSEVQQRFITQTFEATNDQLQIFGQIRDPREFASAQADLVKNHGQRYVESVNETVQIMADALQEYGDRLERAMSTVSDKQRDSSPRKAA